ncbi:MAG: sigma-70 family RNA polymerase sigma factor [Frankia sp.]
MSAGGARGGGLAADGGGGGGGRRVQHGTEASIPGVPFVDPPVPAVDQAADELVDRARAGDVEAFGLLYDRYQPVVHRYVFYRVGTPVLAEDIVSETFLRAFRGIGGFTWQGRDVGAWLVTIARHLIVDHLKSSRFRMERPTADVLAVAPAVLVAGPEDEVIELMTNAALLDAIRGLVPEQQECVVLRFLEGRSVRETALAMGKNEGAVKALQYRAVRALARTLPAGAVGRG